MTSALPNLELFVLSGPTAVGKSELALRWAEANDAEIVSCDSLLFYRGMDLGTAKPTANERARVPHHLIDICDLTDRMDITRFVTAAKSAIREIFVRGKKVLVVGGSGFYLKAFFGPVADNVDVSPQLRKEIAERLSRDGLAALVADLRGLNSGEIGILDTANPRRVVRALERCRASGLTLAQLHANFANTPGPFDAWKVCLTVLECSPAELEQRIAERVRLMLAAGLVGEVRGLVARGLKENPSAAKAIGYRETIDFIEDRLSASGLEAAIIKNTWALVKKQRTWFRTQLPPHRIADAAQVHVGDLFVG